MNTLKEYNKFIKENKGDTTAPGYVANWADKTIQKEEIPIDKETLNDYGEEDLNDIDLITKKIEDDYGYIDKGKAVDEFFDTELFKKVLEEPQMDYIMMSDAFED